MNASQPRFLSGAKIKSITLIYDEGTDTGNAPGEIVETPGAPGTGAAGLAVVDNIFINGQTITSGHRSKGGDKGNDKDKKDNEDDEGEDD